MHLQRIFRDQLWHDIGVVLVTRCDHYDCAWNSSCFCNLRCQTLDLRGPLLNLTLHDLPLFIRQLADSDFTSVFGVLLIQISLLDKEFGAVLLIGDP